MRQRTSTIERNLWRKRIEDCHASNKSAKTWCAENAVSYRRLLYWRRCLVPDGVKKRDEERSHPQETFLELQDKDTRRFRTAVIFLGNDFHPSSVATLLELLERL